MSRHIINQPINQVRLTNVAVVRMNRGGKRFEIACYRNKVVNYRQGLETDLDEVLQSARIFTNVSKGQFANTKDLQQAFGTHDEAEIARLILDKGTMQVSDLERSHQMEALQREVATWIAANCVHPTSQRPYTIPQIREAMRQAEFNIKADKTLKPQYLECVKILQSKQVLPIERAKMQLELIYPTNQEPLIQSTLQALSIVPTSTTAKDQESHAIVLVDPSLYRELDAVSRKVSGRLEILQQVVRQEGDVNLELELERKKQHQSDEHQGAAAQAMLSQRLQDTLRIGNDKTDVSSTSVAATSHDAIDDDDDGNGNVETTATTNSNLRHNQKKAQKKSKKAKRREKEEAIERQARLEAEGQRLQERGGGEVQPTSTGGIGDSNATDSIKCCNTCGGSFASATQYRAHFRSDWHRYNIKLKLKGVAPIGEQEFLAVDSDAFFDNRM